MKTPSAIESTIAPGRHFKVSGTLSGAIPDNALLRVTLLDEAGNEMRYAAADQKGTDRVIPSMIGEEITVFHKDTEFSEVAYTAPELAAADRNNPYGSAHDATVKCVFTDHDFYALIVSATDPEHGLAETDGFGLVDHDGRPYDALSEGKYQVRVTLSSPDGKELASTSKEIEIGRKEGTIIHEITSETAIKKGGKDLLIEWVYDENLTILDDLLPGFFGTFYQMSFMPMSVSCETAEYLPGKIYMLVYGNRDSSTSYALEVASYLQIEHNTENPDIVKYYFFDRGEPSFAGERASIIAFDDHKNIRICHIDHVKETILDGVFLTTEEQVLDSDTDPADGWEATESAFAIAGVMKPYQLQDDEIVPDDDIYSYYQLFNGADSLVYTFSPADGSDSFSITRTVGVTRINEPDGESTPALYEFYNVFPENTLKAGNSYDVTIQAFDKKGAKIKGAVCTFTITA
ncbi:MAG: hypothetical protein IKD69_09930 [Solobacterium sp.]|nr:hypothetical protein [Solobacterium sp.]